MSKTHVIDGVTYVEVDRKAKVGEKLVIVKGFGWYRNEVGGIYTVIDGSQYGFRRESNDYVYVGHTSNDVDEIYCVMMTDYHVLEPLEEPTVDGTQASPEVIDMLANLARRVTQLEQQLAATQRNLETFAEQTESIKYLAESNEQDIAMLDERTQVINAITKFYGGKR